MLFFHVLWAVQTVTMGIVVEGTGLPLSGLSSAAFQHTMTPDAQ